MLLITTAQTSGSLFRNDEIAERAPFALSVALP